MKKSLQRIGGLCLTALLLGSTLCVGAVSQPPTAEVSYTGNDQSGKVEISTDDLFMASKDMMPGDSSDQLIVLNNKSSAAIRVFLKTEPVDLGNAEQNEIENDLIYNQIDLKLSYPTEENGQVVTKTLYEGKLSGMKDSHGNSLQADDDHPNGCTLGYLNGKRHFDMNVNISLPIEMDNRYRNAIAKMKWTFVAEVIPDEDISDDSVPEVGPTNGTTGSADENIPDDLPPLDAPQTGEIPTWIWPTVAAASAAVVCVVLFAVSKRKKKSQDSDTVA